MKHNNGSFKNFLDFFGIVLDNHGQISSSINKILFEYRYSNHPDCQDRLIKESIPILETIKSEHKIFLHNAEVRCSHCSCDDVDVLNILMYNYEKLILTFEERLKSLFAIQNVETNSSWVFEVSPYQRYKVLMKELCFLNTTFKVARFLASRKNFVKVSDGHR